MRPSARRLQRGALMLGMGLATLWPRPGQAYVCARSSSNSGSSLAWFSRNVAYAFNAAGTAQLSQQDAFGTIRNSFAAWQQLSTRPNLRCPAAQTNLTFNELSPTTQTFIGYNFLAPEVNQNIVIFRDAEWPYSAADSGDVAARTTVTYNAVTGQILDADIEFNSKNFVFTTTDTDVKTDLGNVASHEIGHLLGFDHSLERSATMGPITLTGEIGRRRLACDDVAIMGFRYPAGAQDVGYCSPPTPLCGFCAPRGTSLFTPDITLRTIDDGRGGCQQAPNGGASLAVGLALLFATRRRWAAG